MLSLTKGHCLPFALGALLAACSSGSSGSRDGGPGQRIGVQGGVVTSEDDRVTLTIPPGALSSETTIAVTRMALGSAPEVLKELSAVRGVWSLAPAGTAFSAPVTVEIQLDRVIPDGTRDSLVPVVQAAIWDETNGFTSLGSTETPLTLLFDAEAGTTTVRGKLEHFSTLVVADSGLLAGLAPVSPGVPTDSRFDVPLFLRNGRPTDPSSPAYQIRSVEPVAEGAFAPEGEATTNLAWLTRPEPLAVWGPEEMTIPLAFRAGGTETPGSFGARIDYTLQPPPSTSFEGESGSTGTAMGELGRLSGITFDNQLVMSGVNHTMYNPDQFPTACCLANGCRMIRHTEINACRQVGGVVPISEDVSTCRDCDGACCGRDGSCTFGPLGQCDGRTIRFATCKPNRCGNGSEVRRGTGSATLEELAEVLGEADPERVSRYVVETKVTKVVHSKRSVGEQQVRNDLTTIVLLWWLTVNWGLNIVDLFFNNSEFECGAGEHAFTVCPSSPENFPEGDALLVAQVVRTAVPHADPVNHYQYGFVFETNGDPSDDYVAPPEFASDFFQGTDVWFEAQYDPTGGWRLKKTIPSTGFDAQPTAARILIRDNVLMLVVPQSELGTATPRARVTAFRHTGDFGINPPHDWDGSLFPAVAEGLRALDSD